MVEEDALVLTSAKTSTVDKTDKTVKTERRVAKSFLIRFIILFVSFISLFVGFTECNGGEAVIYRGKKNIGYILCSDFKGRGVYTGVTAYVFVL